MRVYQFRHDRIVKSDGKGPRRPGKARRLAKRLQARNGFASVPPRDSGKRGVYHGDRGDYDAQMLFVSLALAAIARVPASPPPALASAQASVRIVQGKEVHFGAPDARLVKASVTTENGQRQTAYLIEFE